LQKTSGIRALCWSLLIAAKALARYPEIKEDKKGHFAEYFLIGTLTSVSLALFAGLVLMKLQSQF